MKRKKKIVNDIDLNESIVYNAFYSYSDEREVLDYDYFINIYLPKSIGVASVDDEMKLKAYINYNSELFEMIKSKCEKTLDTSAKQDAIQYIKEFGKNKKDKIIINIFKTKKNED